MKRFAVLALISLLLLSSALAVLGSANSETEEHTDNWLSGWQYRRGITITNSLDSDITNYQIDLVVHYGAGTDSGKDVYLGSTIEYFKISISTSAHNDYGLGYPVTYVFNIPSGISGLKVFKRYSSTDEWTQLTEKTSDDFFNGIECVRFDYTANKAYVSVAFSDVSDEIHIKFTDSDGNNISNSCSFDHIAKYYDNRKATVVFTADDWNDEYNEVFKTACDVTRVRHIWFTPALITANISSSTWADIQEKLNAGYLEVASHSRTHPHTPYDDYDSEIGGSKQDIINNLTLPDIYRKGDTQYVWAWIEPYGNSDSTVRAKLGQYKYLCDRDITTDNDFVGWDDANGLYDSVGYSIRMGTDGTTDLTTLNNNFDSRYANGQIYHLMCHPHKVDWSDGSYALQHLDYISNRTDVWYVGFGALYAYHYVQEHAQVSTDSASAKVRADFGDIRFTDSDGQTLLSYWIEEKVDGDYAKFWVKVPSIPAGGSVNIYMYYGNPSATDESNMTDVFIVGCNFDDGTLCGFEDISEGSSYIAVSSDYSISSPNSLMADSVASNTRAMTKRSFSVSGDFRYSYWFRPGTVTYFLIISSDSTSLARLRVQDGHLEYYDGSTYTTVQDISLNTWYKVEVRAYVSTHTVDIYVNDELKLSGASWEHTGTPAYFKMGVGDGSNCGTSYLDNFFVAKYNSGISYSIGSEQVAEEQYTIFFYSNNADAGIILNGYTYYSGDTVQLTNGTYSISAVVPSGYTFDYWSVVDLSIADAYSESTTVTVNGKNGEIHLFVTEEQYTVTFYTNVTGATITVNGQTYSNGQSAQFTNGQYTVTANPPDGYKFDKWVTTGITVSNYNAQTTTMIIDGCGGSLSARFVPETEEQYTVTFQAEGISNLPWSVTIGENTYNSNTNTIMVSLPNGTYSYTVNPPDGYNATPSSGSFTVNGADLTISITFTQIDNTNNDTNDTNNTTGSGGAGDNNTGSSSDILENIKDFADDYPLTVVFAALAIISLLAGNRKAFIIFVLLALASYFMIDPYTLQGGG